MNIQTKTLATFMAALMLLNPLNAKTETGLKIVRGTTQGKTSRDQSIKYGKGFTVTSNVSGNWAKVTFDTDNTFAEPPTITTSFNFKHGSPFYDRFIFLDGVTKDGFNYIVRNSSGTDCMDVDMGFIAIGLPG